MKPKQNEKCEEGLLIRYVQAFSSNFSSPLTSHYAYGFKIQKVELDKLLPFYCFDCEISFRSQWRLEKHLQSNHHIYSMEECGVLPKGSFDEIKRQGINLYELNSSDYVTLLQTLQQLLTR